MKAYVCRQQPAAFKHYALCVAKVIVDSNLEKKISFYFVCVCVPVFFGDIENSELHVGK